MFSFLRKLAGAEAEVVIKERNEKLAELEQQGKELDKLTQLLVAVQKAAENRSATAIAERDRLQRSRSGTLRLKLDSSPAVKT